MRGALPAFVLLVAAAQPAAAQRLAYWPVSDEALASSPRLAYQPVEGDTAPAASIQTTTPAAERQRRWPRWALLDRLEYASQKGRDGYGWDFSALLGGERNRLWVANVGEGEAWAAPDYLEFHTLYSRYVGGNVDLNFGLRWDALPHPNRAYATAGAQYDDDKLWLGAFSYLSQKGEMGVRFAGLYNYEIVKALFLQPSFEIDASGEDMPDLGIGRGFYYAEAGLRLRYEFEDGKLAPYVGLSWSRDLGRTARLTREAGDDPETKSLVLGLRSAF